MVCSIKFLGLEIPKYMLCAAILAKINARIHCHERQIDEVDTHGIAASFAEAWEKNRKK